VAGEHLNTLTGRNANTSGREGAPEYYRDRGPRLAVFRVARFSLSNILNLYSERMER
jgi:hypothetical protein